MQRILLFLALLLVASGGMAVAETGPLTKSCPAQMRLSDKDAFCLYNEDGKVMAIGYTSEYINRMNARQLLLEEELRRMKREFQQQIGGAKNELKKEINKVQEASQARLAEAQEQNKGSFTEIKGTLNSQAQAFEEASRSVGTQIASLGGRNNLSLAIASFGILGIIVLTMLSFSTRSSVGSVAKDVRALTEMVANEINKSSSPAPDPSPKSSKKTSSEESTRRLEEVPTMIAPPRHEADESIGYVPEIPSSDLSAAPSKEELKEVERKLESGKSWKYNPDADTTESPESATGIRVAREPGTFKKLWAWIKGSPTPTRHEEAA